MPSHRWSSFVRVAALAATTLAAGGALPACSAVPTEATAVPAGAQRLAGADIGALVQRAQQSVQVFDDSHRGGLSYELMPGGELQVRSRSLRKVVFGQWRLDDGGSSGARLCVRIERDPESCGAVYRLDGGRFYFDQPEQAPEANTFTLRTREKQR